MDKEQECKVVEDEDIETLYKEGKLVIEEEAP